MKRISAFGQFVMACLQWFHKTKIATENTKTSVPPIRYDGDPTDIYLA